MDSIDIGLRFVLGIAIFALAAVVIVVPFAIYDSIMLAPERADNAIKICNDKGYISYEGYTSKPFSTKPYGVKCVHERIDVEIVSTGIPIVVGGVV